MATETDNPRLVKTAPFRASFPNIPPYPPREDEKTKRRTFGLGGMLFPPGTDMKPYHAALKAAMVAKFGTDTKQWPKIKRKPSDVIKDFASYNADAKTPLKGDWNGWMMIRANAPADHPPVVVGPTKGPDNKFPVVTDRREVYGGRWMRATIEAFYFKGDTNNGVTFGLKGVQLLKADSSFGGALTSAEDQFDDAPEGWSGEADAFEKGAGDEKHGTKPADHGDDWN
jgi:hypothetical protein